MSAFWKGVLAVYNLLLVLVGILIIATALGYPEPMLWLQAAFATHDNRLAAGATGALLGIIGLYALIQSISVPQVSSMMVQESSDGSVTITVAAIKQIILKAVKQVEGVKEVKPSVKRGKNGGAVEMTSSIQEKVRQFLQEVGGLQVEEVRVTVDDFASKPGVR
jgi:uncharacterized membrane protein